MILAIKNWFLFIGQQWLDSLRFFLPKNFKLFFMVTLNAWWQASKVFFLHFWYLILLQWTLIKYVVYFLEQSILPLSSLFYVNVILKALAFLVIFFMFLSARPSVERKNYHYFFSYMKQYCLLIVLILILAHLADALSGVNNKYWTFKSPILIFVLCFFLDTKGELSDLFYSCLRGLKMFFYGFPFALIIGLPFSFGFDYLFIPPTYKFIAALCYMLYFNAFFLLYISCLNTFYIKRAHEDYELYFK